MKKLIVFILILASGLTACQDGALLDVYEDFPEGQWNYDQVLEMEFDIQDTSVYYQWFANLKINSDYEYSNFFMKMKVTAPDSNVSEEVIALTLAEKSGKWLGSGLGDALTYQIPISNKKVFKQSGTYKVTLEQHMRKEIIPNVLAAGLKLNKQEEIF